MSRRPEGPPPPVAVQKLRVRWSRTGRLRFSSHRDFQRALERALRRANVPMAYSAGFTPHPKISYAGAAPTGAQSLAEYFEIGLVNRVDPEQVRTSVDAVLPDGLTIEEVVEAGPGALADRLTGSFWVIELPGVTRQDAADACAAFLAAPEVLVERVVKAGRRTMDARAAVVDIGLYDGPMQLCWDQEKKDLTRPELVDTENGSGTCAILGLVVRHTTPAIRPDDVLTALRAVGDLATPLPAKLTRLGQGPLDEQSRTVADPLAADRAVIGA